jgi:hypothetical protein
LNHLTIGYEQVLGCQTSIVVKAGYIGRWKQGTENIDVYDSKGVLLTVGVKFILPRSVKRMASLEEAHPSAGWYLRPKLLFNAWTRAFYPASNTLSYHDQQAPTSDYATAAIVLVIGCELFLGEHVTFDISGAMGYGAEWQQRPAISTGRYRSPRLEYAFTHLFHGSTSPLVVSGGLRLGYVF